MKNVKHLLPQTTYYKANLHTHSTISDGELPLDEVKELYTISQRTGVCKENDLLNLGSQLFPPGTDDMHTARAAGLSRIMAGAI